jgi:protein disulfide-isomerase A1
MRNEFSFGIVFDQDDLAKEYGVTSPGVVMRRNFDDGDVVFSGEFGAENFASELTDFIKGQSFPLVGEIGPETYQKYIERGFNFVWIFVDYNDEAQTAMIKDAITPSAAEYRSELSFVKLDGIRWGEHAKSFGLSGGTPGIVIEDREKRANFVFPEDSDITADAFAKFVASYKDGSLKAHVKSDPEPETNDGPVFVLVGDAFERVAKDTTKDVLVEFYAPWCGHCKKLAPIYEEVGEAFADNDNVIIAKMDSTTNDAIGEDIRGFPTIKFYPADDDQTAVEYDGGRTKDDMIKFINENGKAGAAAASSEEPASEEAGHDEL